ncbi:YdeI/OmpD-associated family protein [Luteolibacter sp. GHJ8]|uniref:YdeI/OmpD-associated family protein n=1 Tax=Luteolibacter rhizosphaerae TaxID=2989719 RepID=A0ABT3FXC4_9BACT|nr:YdeI/OmpD-associated family protein [Luteolibacter rhizosphaerae]MCW1912213.1 YdeI/OmpD-associated family protein [Luteolibacter rhizosphaerae]
MSTKRKDLELPVLPFADGKGFTKWLGKQPLDSPGLWLKFANKGSGIPGITQQEALDAALCHGWIDGQRLGLDDDYYLNKYTPRRSRSNWSQINRARALELIAEGRMTERGQAEIERAKQDGRWEAASAPPSKAEVPEDLAAALRKNKVAKALFERLDHRNRFAILHRVGQAKKAETRAARIAKLVAMLAEGELIYPPKKS